MKKRVITAIAMMAAIVPLSILGGVYFLILGMFLSAVASYELMSMFYTKSPALKYYRYIVPLMSVIIVLSVYLASTKGLDPDLFYFTVQEDGTVITDTSRILTIATVRTQMLYHFWVMTIFLAFILICLGSLLFVKLSTAHDMMACIITLCYCGLTMAYVVNIRYIQPIGQSVYFENKIYGGRSFAYVFAICCLTDTFAYLFGCKFGKHKLCPTISPKKSVEGAIAGLAGGSILGTISVFAFGLIEIKPGTSFVVTLSIVALILVISIAISIAVQMGDLVASKLKRSYDIKDYGKIFPGHGGVLDRFDSLIFAGALYYVIIQFIQFTFLGVA